MSEPDYYIATPLDGVIAHRDGGFGGFEWDDEFASDFFADQRRFGTVLMRSKPTKLVSMKERQAPIKR